MDALEVVERFGLQPHPEGGYFREIYRSDNLGRAHGTAILFLLPGETFSAWHVVDADEQWHFYTGAPLELHTIEPDGTPHAALLGTDFANGQAPTTIVPRGVLQSAASTGAWTLCGCTVAPGFLFEGFEMPAREELLRRFPTCSELVLRFTRTA